MFLTGRGQPTFFNKFLDQITPKLVVAIDLRAGAVQETKEALEDSGMNEHALFPDLDGLARQLKKKYGID